MKHRFRIKSKIVSPSEFDIVETPVGTLLKCELERKLSCKDIRVNQLHLGPHGVQQKTGFMWIEHLDSFDAMLLDQLANEDKPIYSMNQVRQMDRIAKIINDRLNKKRK